MKENFPTWHYISTRDYPERYLDKCHTSHSGKTECTAHVLVLFRNTVSSGRRIRKNKELTYTWDFKRKGLHLDNIIAWSWLPTQEYINEISNRI